MRRSAKLVGVSDMSPEDVYEDNPEAGSDDGFEPGTIAHLVAGNRGRMLDPRRTPVAVGAVDDATATFEVVVEAFEDRGARWRLPVEDVVGFQFERGAARLASGRRDELRTLADRFAGTVEVVAGPEAREGTLRALDGERERVRPLLAATPALAAIDLVGCVARREGDPAAVAALDELLDGAGLAALDRELAVTYVSNPRSGEVVKGHAIVLAEMGLCPYTGPKVRDPALFSGTGTKAARRAHVLLRLAFLAELFALLGRDEVELFRGVALDGPRDPVRPASFVAATFAREVAEAHFSGATASGLLARQRVPTARLFMTFLETAAMNARYREAEAVLLGDPGNRVF